MSALNYCVEGGAALVAGSFSIDDTEETNEILRDFLAILKKTASQEGIPVSQLKVIRCSRLFLIKDVALYHFIFIDEGGQTRVDYRTLEEGKKLNIKAQVSALTADIGEVDWYISAAQASAPSDRASLLHAAAEAYVEYIRRKTTAKKEQEMIPAELSSGVAKFRADYPSGSKVAFIVMQFGATKLHNEIVSCLKRALRDQHLVVGLRADDKEYMDDLFPNIKTYMHCCDFGIAVFERITEDDFNPNVSLEVGYMMGIGKPVLLLKDQTLKLLPSDLAGKLYRPFDTSDIEGTIPIQLKKWLEDKGLYRK